MNNLPSDLIKNGFTWDARQILDRKQQWNINLSQTEIQELEKAADNFLEKSIEIAQMKRVDFQLPNFSAKLKAIADRLVNGPGFVIIRSLPVHRYSKTYAAIIFYGMGLHLGTPRSQNAQGHLLGHVRDVGAHSHDVNTRIYQTCDRQTFHTDSADVVGLLSLQDAKSGGDSLLVSAVSIYNVMLKKHPDLLKFLFDPIATDRRGEIPKGEKPYFEIPVFNWHEENLTVMYQRQYIDSAQRFDDALRLTKLHIKALDQFDKIANDDRLILSMRLAPGDIQFVYNHALLHDRTAFTDWPQLQKRRHLLRLWLSMPNDRTLPDCFKQRFGSVKIGERGGIITDNVKLNVMIN